jgi:hypothetical protein
MCVSLQCENGQFKPRYGRQISRQCRSNLLDRLRSTKATTYTISARRSLDSRDPLICLITARQVVELCDISSQLRAINRPDKMERQLRQQNDAIYTDTQSNVLSSRLRELCRPQSPTKFCSGTLSVRLLFQYNGPRLQPLKNPDCTSVDMIMRTICIQ